MTVKAMTCARCRYVGVLLLLTGISCTVPQIDRTPSHRDGAIATGALVVVLVENTTDFQWSALDSGVALYPGYVLKKPGGVSVKYQNPPYHVTVQKVEDSWPMTTSPK